MGPITHCHVDKLVTLACARTVSHFAFHSHSCRYYTAIRNLTSQMCNTPGARKPLSIHSHECSRVSYPATLSDCKHVFPDENWHSNFFRSCQIVVRARVRACMCLPMSARCYLQGCRFSFSLPPPPGALLVPP